MKKIVVSFLIALGVACVASAPALAHKVVASAFVSGDHIEGEIGFSDGSMAKNAEVDVLTEDGTRIGATKTGEDGSFVFVPTKPVTHVFHADLGGGHIANFKVDKADLPAALLGANGAAPAAAAPISGAQAVPVPASAAQPPSSPAALADAQRLAIAEAVRNEMKPLRREIIALKEKNDVQSILGGIGYIAGLFGLWFFLAARRRASKAG
jgi:nickel transport protein